MWNKKYEEEFCKLPIKHDWMFTHLFVSERVLRPFLEALLGRKVGAIKVLDREKTLDGDYGSRGVRLDICADDSGKVIYNVEMQNVNYHDLPYRIRYQQSRIDNHLLNKGDKFEDLPQTIIIFICDFDFIGEGYALYKKEVRYSPSIEIFNDVSSVYILNSKFLFPNVNSDIEEFLQSCHLVLNMQRAVVFCVRIYARDSKKSIIVMKKGVIT